MRMKLGENKLELTEAVVDLGTMCHDVLLPVFNVNMPVTHLTLLQGLLRACLYVRASLICFWVSHSAENNCFFFF